jgi:Rad3-related DNA helicase
VDEAHNLVERTRRMYSASLSLGELRDAQAQAPAVAKAALAQLLDAAATVAQGAAEPYTVWPDLPDELADALEAAAAGLAEHFQHQPLATGALLGFHFKLQRWLRLVDNLGPHALLDVMRGGGDSRGGASADAGPERSADGAADDDRRQAMMTLSLQGTDAAVGTPAEDLLTADEPGPAAHAADDAVISVRNLVPAPWLRPRWQALHSATLFSATLWPPEHARQLLGLPDDTAWVDIPPAFPPEHLRVQVARGVSTRYAHRPHSLDRLVAVLARQWDAHPGNYLAFFSSFDYLAQAADRLAVLRPDIPQWRQQRHMPADERQAFLERFRPDGQGLGFAVLGGVFSEGVDLPGTRLIGAFIATLALPPVSPLQDEVQARLAQLFGAEAGFADRVPAMQKVVQAAGRVLRTPTDRGWLWLLDDRYRQPAFARLLPRWWGLGPAEEAGDTADAHTPAAPPFAPMTRH